MIRNQYQDADERVPDVAVRFHRHHYQPGPYLPKPWFFYAPSWQLTTPFGYRVGAGAIVEPVGLLIFIVEDGRVTLDDSQIFKFPKRKPWRVKGE